jgi:hypothetical protein
VASGSVFTPGYVFDPASVATFGALRLDDALQFDSSKTTVTVAFRDDRPIPVVLAAEFDRAGFSSMMLTEQAELLDVSPLVARVPDATLLSIVSKVAASAGNEWYGLRRISRQRVVVSTPWGVVIESVVRFGQNGLFGIATIPPTASAFEAVFLNAANEGHIGPARLWPLLARRWAAEGNITGLRFDFSGIGDSPDPEHKPRDTTYLPQWIDDADDAVARATDGGRQAVAVGLCSGAYAALEAALRQPLAGVVITNPVADSIYLTEHNRDPLTADPRRRAFREWPGFLARFAVKHRRPATFLWRALQQVVPSKSAMAVVGEVVRRGPMVFLALGPEDRNTYDVNWYWRLRSQWLRREGRIERTDIPTLHHSALTDEGRDVLSRSMTRHVMSHYGRAAAARDAEDAEGSTEAVLPDLRGGFDR